MIDEVGVFAQYVIDYMSRARISYHVLVTESIAEKPVFHSSNRGNLGGATYANPWRLQNRLNNLREIGDIKIEKLNEFQYSNAIALHRFIFRHY